MKTFTTAINEGVSIPQFVHPELNTPNDPDGKFWTLVNLSNKEYDKTSKKSYSKVSKLANDLYTELTMMTSDDNISQAMEMISQAMVLINKSSEDAPEEMTSNDLKWLKNVMFLIQGIDARLSKHRWYKDAHIDVKAGYVPMKGTGKNTKIKYRVLVKLPQAVSDQVYKGITRDILNMSPMHRNYIAGIEWNKEHTKFSILITNTEGYKV